MIKFLRSVPLFTKLTTAEIATLVKMLDWKKFNTKDYIITEGELDKVLYVIYKGSVQVLKRNEVGEEVEIVFMQAGNYFGELSLIDYRPRSASVRCFEETEVLLLSSVNFEQFTLKHPEAEVKVLKSLLINVSDRLRATNENLTYFKNLLF